MASSSIKGITVEIGGDTVGLQNALKDVNKRGRELTSELRQIDRALKFNPDNVELLAQRQQLLTQQVENTTRSLDTLREAQEQVERQFQNGEIGEEAYRAFQRELITTESRLNHYTTQLEEMQREQDDAGDSADEAAEDLEDLEKQAKETEGAMSKLGGGFKTAMGGIAAGAAAGAAAIGGLVTGMEDVNKELARLRSNASRAGFDIAGVEEGFQKIASVTGDTGAAVETVSNLMATGFSDNQMAKVIEEINGAYIQFSDTLSTEGIADGIQETFGVGEAAGSFAELLERSGVSLDTFNAGLAEAAKNGTETDYVLQQLSSLGLASAYEEYQKLNPEIVAQQEAQIALQMALSELSIALTPLVTMVTEFLTKIIEWGNENLKLGESFSSIVDGLTQVLPQVGEKGLELITNLVQAIIENFPMIYDVGLQMISKVYEGIGSMLPQLITLAISLVTSLVTTILDNLPQILDIGVQLLLSLIDGIVQTLPDLLAAALDLVVKIVTTIGENLPKIIDAGASILTKLIEGIAKLLPDLSSTVEDFMVDIYNKIVDNLPEILEVGGKILESLIDGILGIVGELLSAIGLDVLEPMLDKFKEIDLVQVGKDIIRGLIEGIASMASSLMKKVRELADLIPDGLKDFLGIHSPSRVLRDEVGKWIPLGLAEGIESGISAVSSATKSMANMSIPTLPKYEYSLFGTGSMSGTQNITIMLDSEVIGRAVAPIVGEEIVLRVGRW